MTQTLSRRKPKEVIDDVPGGGDGLLNLAERARLETNEASIAWNLRSFVDVGVALAEIRDFKLHRETHETFDAYVRDRWDFQRAYAYRLIAAAEVVADVAGVSPKGDTKKKKGIQPRTDLVPMTESHARAMVKLDRDERREVWKQVLHDAPKVSGVPRITAELVAITAKRYITPPDELPEELREPVAQKPPRTTHHAPRTTVDEIDAEIIEPDDLGRHLWNGLPCRWAGVLHDVRDAVERITRDPVSPLELLTNLSELLKVLTDDLEYFFET